MGTFDFSSSLNPLYTYEAVQDQMRTSFAKSKPSVLLLNDFLIKKRYDALFHTLGGLQGTSLSEPDRLSYTHLDLPQAVRGFFASPAFFDFVTSATGIKVRDVKLETRRFGHRDFTLLHDEQESNSRFIFLYMVASPAWKMSWGGSPIFSFGDERKPLVFEPRGNTFILFNVPRGMREFVKYVNHFAGKEKLIYLEGAFL